MSPCFTSSATSLACSWERSHSVKFRWQRPPFTSLWTSQETGATLEYQGHVVSLLWQSKQARRINSLVVGEFQSGSFATGGLTCVRPKGTNWIKTAARNTHMNTFINIP